MKTTLTLTLLLCSLVAIAQKKARPNPFRQLGPAKNTLPPNTDSLLDSSAIVYSNLDNMPVLIVQSNDKMVPFYLPLVTDTIPPYKMPNPLYKKRKIAPQKP